MELCQGCKNPIWFWQKKDLHGRPWHRRCFASWEEGYRTAQKFANEENRIAGFKGPWDLYGERMMNQYHVDQDEIYFKFGDGKEYRVREKK